MKQENRLRRLEDRRTTLTGSDGARRLGEFLDRLADRLTGTDDAAGASPAVIAALVLREGRLASPAILQRAEALAPYPGPVGKLFEGILGGSA
jgi:hypothetical protein